MDEFGIIAGNVPIPCSLVDARPWIDLGCEMLDGYLLIPYEVLFPIGSTLDMTNIRESCESLY